MYAFKKKRNGDPKHNPETGTEFSNEYIDNLANSQSRL